MSKIFRKQSSVVELEDRTKQVYFSQNTITYTRTRLSGRVSIQSSAIIYCAASGQKELVQRLRLKTLT
jgi:hypothetical protein